MIYRNISCNCLLYQFICPADSIRHLTFNHFLPIKSVHGNLCICCNDNTVCLFDFLCSQHVLCPAGSSGFYSDITILLFRCLLKCLCSHISMSNSRGTGCHGKNLYLRTFCLARVRQSFVNTCFFFICFVNNCKEFIHRFCIAEIIRKFLIHHQHRKFTQHIKVDIILCIRRCNQENQRNRFSVQ